MGCMEGYRDILFLTVLAIGGAVAAGTGAALWRYRRTGAFPGQPPEESAERRASGLRGARIKLVLGMVLFGWGLVSLLVR